MGIHDRDYVRNKEFDYKKMEYVPNKSSSSNENLDDRPIFDYKYLPIFVLIFLFTLLYFLFK
jgi:hypothetical protein